MAENAPSGATEDADAVRSVYFDRSDPVDLQCQRYDEVIRQDDTSTFYLFYEPTAKHN